MFRVGDRVRLLNNDGRAFIPIGSEFTVLDIQGSKWNPGQTNLYVEVEYPVRGRVIIGLRSTRFEKISRIKRNLPQWF